MTRKYQPGDVINHKYRITSILGEGGVAITYGAIDLATEEAVAIKVISLKQLKDWKQIELFKREAEVLAKLEHSGIPKYLDYFDIETEKDKAFYLVQQQASGQSLWQLIENGWHTNELEVKNIAKQILSILIYLHSLDPPVVHRDIKPHNLIYSEDNKIYLVDFGAVQNTYYNTLMQGSTVVGTYGYMAPEQFRGKSLPATDLYSLGGTLLYLLTHKPPVEFPQDTLKLKFRHAVDISVSFADWLDRILEPDIADRWNSASQALRELDKEEISIPIKISTRRKISLLSFGLLFIAVTFLLNTYKWQFLSTFGYQPLLLCKNIGAIEEYLNTKGRLNINVAHKISLISCIDNLENTKERDLAIAKIKAEYGSQEYQQALLIDAVLTNNYERVKQLIADGLDINFKFHFWKTPLTIALDRRKLEIAKLLLENGATIDRHTGKKYLQRAVDGNNLPMVKFLLKKGININRSEATVYLRQAVMSNNLEIAKIAINRGANVNAIYHYSPVQRKNSQDIIYNKKSLLKISKMKNNKEMIDFLRKHGARR